MSHRVTTAAVLAGGLGTRLRPAVSARPKVLAPVCGRPFLAYLLDQVADAGLERAVLCTGYLAEQVRAEFGDRYRTLRVGYSVESSPLGTGGALRQALPLLDGDPVLVLNGDSYCAADLQRLVAEPQAAPGSAGTLVVTWMDDTSRYGSVDIDDRGVIRAFHEKAEGAGPGWINAGVYLLSRRLLASIPDAGVVSIERDVFPQWMSGELRACRVNAPFLDIGTPESYAQAEAFFAGGRPPGHL